MNCLEISSDYLRFLRASLGVQGNRQRLEIVFLNTVIQLCPFDQILNRAGLDRSWEFEKFNM